MRSIQILCECKSLLSWWRHQMETLSALLALCVGNSPVPGEFPAQRPVTRSFDVFFDLRPNNRLSKQSWGWWFETLSCSLWRHCNVISALGYWTSFLRWLFSFSLSCPLSPSFFTTNFEILFKYSHDINGLEQERRNSSTIAQELRLYCPYPSISLDIKFQHDRRHCRME